MKVCTTCGSEYPDEQKFCPKDGTPLRGPGGAQDLVGSVIAERYHIQKKLGEGGMGAVYLGEHVKMGRMSAIKVMAQSMANDPDAIARFNREAANAARINHPNVCQIYDFGETPEGLIYLAMEFIEGEALTDLIEREGALAPPRAASIIRQAGDALQTAHDMGIVHRDLKPDNIMIARGRDGTDLVKVVDFGIAKAMGGEEGQKVTKTGLVVGTPEYMSPEQLSGDTLDGRSDIYSLALVLYRMLTGTLPFEADSAQEVMIKRLTDEPMPLQQARPDAGFPDRLQEVMHQALARMPGERYDSAHRFGGDVVAAVGGMPADAGPADDGATQLMDGAEMTAAAQSAPTAQLASTRVGGEAQRAPTAVPTPDTAQPAPPPAAAASARKTPMGMIAAVVVGLAAVGGGAAVVLSGGDQLATAPDSTAVPVTNGTADSSPGAQREDSARPAPPPGTRRESVTTPETTATEPPAIDVAALEQRLAELSRQMDDAAALPRARQEAQRMYDNPDLPVGVRGLAAATVAESYLVEGRMDQACRWVGLARTLDPASEGYRRTFETLGCV